MANRMFNQFQGTLEKGVVTLYAEVSFGAAGAPTLVKSSVNGGCKGIASITKSATGTYTVTLQDSYIRTLGISSTWKDATAAAAPSVVLNADNVAASSPNVSLKTYSTAGAATDPASGEVLLLTLTLSNSSAL